jgi:hypothetical protein
MTAPGEPRDLTTPARFALPAAYQQRLQPEYFTDGTDDGITWQPDVYPHAADLARHLGRTVVIDIGCGRAGKLATLHQTEPDWHYIGADFGPNIEWCRANHTFGEWIEVNLEACKVLPIPDHHLRQAVIICSDVLEHLIRPDIALGMMVALAIVGNNAPVVLSTPARERRAGAGYLGQPRNPAHVREWTSTEFETFVAASGFSIHDAHLTRSDDYSQGPTTQLVTAYPTAREQR